MGRKLILFILILSLINLNNCKSSRVQKTSQIPILSQKKDIVFENLSNLKKLTNSKINDLKIFVSDAVRNESDIFILYNEDISSDSASAKGRILRWNIKDRLVKAKSNSISQPRNGIQIFGNYIFSSSKHYSKIIDVSSLKKNFGSITGYAPYLPVDFINNHMYVIDKFSKYYAQSLHFIDFINNNHWQYPTEKLAYSSNIAFFKLVIEDKDNVATFITDSNDNKLKLLILNNKTGNLVKIITLSDLIDAEGFMYYPDDYFHFKENNSKNIIKTEDKIIISFRTNNGVKIICYELNTSLSVKLLWEKEYEAKLRVNNNDPHELEKGISIDSNFQVIDNKLTYILSKFNTENGNIVFDNTLITFDISTGKEISNIKLESKMMCNWIRNIEINNKSYLLCYFTKYDNATNEECNSLSLVSLNPFKIEWSRNYKLGVRSQIKVKDNLIWILDNNIKRVITLDLLSGKGLSSFDIPPSEIKKIKIPTGGEEEIPDFIGSSNYIFPISKNMAYLIAFDGRIYELEER